MFDTSIEVKEGNLATQASNMLQVFFAILMSMFSTSVSKGGELTTQAPNIFITIFRRSIIAWYDCFVKLNLVFHSYIHPQHRIKNNTHGFLWVLFHYFFGFFGAGFFFFAAVFFLPLRPGFAFFNISIHCSSV
jgi:hypothetical protein